jgi:ADP-heptose:LPS heptosyltransferase
MQPDWSWLRDPADTLLAQYKLNPGFILLLPGCSNRHPEKRWPGFAELSSKLLAKGFSVVIAPGPDEMDLLHTIPGTWVLDQGNPLSIPKLLGLAQHAALVIGNDSGPTHLLACSHTRGIALFHKKRYVHDTNIEQAYTVFCAHPIAKISTEQVYQTTCQQLSLAHQKPKHSAV